MRLVSVKGLIALCWRSSVFCSHFTPRSGFINNVDALELKFTHFVAKLLVWKLAKEKFLLIKARQLSKRRVESKYKKNTSYREKTRINLLFWYACGVSIITTLFFLWVIPLDSKRVLASPKYSSSILSFFSWNVFWNFGCGKFRPKLIYNCCF